MKYFYALVHKDADSAFGVTFPDLPGCFSAADELEDVVPTAIDALELWFEDAQPVAPSSLAEVNQMVADELTQGAFLVAVPWIDRDQDERAVRVNISLSRAVLEAIDKAAEMRSVTRSAFLTAAAQQMMIRNLR